MDTPAETLGERPRITLEGTYTPADYLEEPVELEGTDYTATIAAGRIEVSFREPEPLPDADRQAAIRRELDQIFDSHMILTCRSAAVTGLTLTRHQPDGRKDVWVYATANIILAGDTFRADTIVTDSEGNARDSRAERLADQRRFREQHSRQAEDPLLKGLMSSFRQAIADRADQMTHLYEIRDALSRHFKGDKQARNALGLTNAEWSDLGRIANHEPIEESRHRGNHAILRQATAEERNRAIEVASRMIRAYLNYLSSIPQAKPTTVASAEHIQANRPV